MIYGPLPKETVFIDASPSNGIPIQLCYIKEVVAKCLYLVYGFTKMVTLSLYIRGPSLHSMHWIKTTQKIGFTQWKIREWYSSLLKLRYSFVRKNNIWQSYHTAGWQTCSLNWGHSQCTYCCCCQGPHWPKRHKWGTYSCPPISNLPPSYPLCLQSMPGYTSNLAKTTTDRR